MSKSAIAGLILTGGKNSRMNGQVKLYLTCDGESFLERIAGALAQIPEIYLSVNDKAFYERTLTPEESSRFQLIEDRYPGIGPMGGILSSMELLKGACEALFIVSSDLPFLDSKTVGDLLAAYERGKMLTLAESLDGLQPLIGIYPLALLESLQAQVEKGDYRMFRLIEQIPLQTVKAAEKAVCNINTPADYERYCRADRKKQETEAVKKKEKA